MTCCSCVLMQMFADSGGSTERERLFSSTLHISNLHAYVPFRSSTDIHTCVFILLESCLGYIAVVSASYLQI